MITVDWIVRKYVGRIRKAPNVFVLVDDDRGKKWWCALCGATGMGRLLPHVELSEVERLAVNHNKRHHRGLVQ